MGLQRITFKSAQLFQFSSDRLRSFFLFTVRGPVILRLPGTDALLLVLVSVTTRWPVGVVPFVDRDTRLTYKLRIARFLLPGTMATLVSDEFG